MRAFTGGGVQRTYGSSAWLNLKGFVSWFVGSFVCVSGFWFFRTLLTHLFCGRRFFFFFSCLFLRSFAGLAVAVHIASREKMFRKCPNHGEVGQELTATPCFCLFLKKI